MNRTPLLRTVVAGDGRFSRHRLIDGWDQGRLSSLGVVVFGVGALGNEVIKNLALVGVGRALLVDQDHVEPSNLSRAVLFREDDRGRPKADVAARRAHEIYPAMELETVVGDLRLTVGPGRIEGYDLALCCLDSIDGRLGVNDLCLRAGMPWWNGGLGPASCEITRYVPGTGPCYGCTLTARARARERRRYSCQSGRPLDLPPQVLPTTAVSASLGGALLVQEALASVMPAMGDRMLPPGRRVLLETSPHRLTSFDVPADPRCPDHAGHTPPDLVSSQDHSVPGSALLRELALDRKRVDLHLDHEVVVRWRCRCPGSVGRPGVPLRRLRGPCQDCGATPDSLDTTMSLQGTDPLLDRPLSELGVPDGGEILLFDGTRTIQVRLSTTQRVLRPEREPSRGSVP